MRKTKIVATLGPSSQSEETIAEMIRTGVDAFRFNMSHGTYEAHRIAFERVRSNALELGRPVATILDLQGPKIRVGMLETDQLMLARAGEVVLTSCAAKGDTDRIPVSYECLEKEVKPDEIILMDDGRLRLKVLQVEKDGVRCRILEGGILKSHKGVNLPGTQLSLPSLSDKDKQDIRFAAELGFDAVALSFVSRASDVLALRDEMAAVGQVRPIIAKLERAACLDDLPGILAAADAVMVARGDLGVEVDIKRVPVLQKRIIAQANARGIPVITATQMLESMTNGLLPTRAEAADVANAVLDGSDAVMLSGETSVGLYPVRAVQMMADIAVEAETYFSESRPDFLHGLHLSEHSIGEAICHTAVVAAHDLGLKHIVAVTRSGRTALDISKLKPNATIHAFAFDAAVRNFLCLSRGVVPHLSKYVDDFERLMNLIDAYLIDKQIAKLGEPVAVTLGAPIAVPGTTTMLMIHNVGKRYEGAHAITMA